MILLLVLLFVGVVTMVVSYLVQFHVDLDGNKEKIIKDGLIKELMNKAVADPDPNSFIIDVNAQTITMGNIVIKKDYGDVFWFPYEVAITDGSSYYWDQKTIGHIIHFSKDYYLVSKLLKKSKTSIEKTQREKLNLNK
jgi:hypothetical protein